MTILTDNLWYGKLLLRILADYYSQHFVCIKPPTNRQEDWKVNFEAHGMKLYEGEPGPQAGHSTQASSYFDRLWQRSSNPERYFITLRKIQTKVPINLQHIPTVRLASSLLMNTQGAVQNKKIVFTEDDTDPIPVKSQAKKSVVSSDAAEQDQADAKEDDGMEDDDSESNSQERNTKKRRHSEQDAPQATVEEDKGIAAKEGKKSKQQDKKPASNSPATHPGAKGSAAVNTTGQSQHGKKSNAKELEKGDNKKKRF